MEILDEQRSDQNIEPLFDPSLQGPINFRDIILCGTSRAFSPGYLAKDHTRWQLLKDKSCQLCN
jgi:hypothetical protein